MSTDRNELPSSANVLVQLVLKIDEGFIRTLRELNVAKDGTCEERSYLFCLTPFMSEKDIARTKVTCLRLNSSRHKSIFTALRVNKPI
jgi:hypothetical protein